MAGDRHIQLSYRVRLAILKHAEMLQKSNARDLAQIRDTGHFFHVCSPRDLFAIETREFFSKWRARRDSNAGPPA